MTQQQDRPTVGDTTSIIHRIAVPSNALVLARAPTDSNLVSMTVPPSITREGDTVRIAYPVTLWASGLNDLVIPGPIIVVAGARPDTLPDLHVMLDVASVLPPRVKAESLAPKPARLWMPSAERSPLAFAVFIPVILALVLLHWWWRRHGPAPVVVPRESVVPLTSARIESWLAAGEGRLLLRHLDAAMEQGPRYEEWRTKAQALRYAPGDDAAVAAVVREGWTLLGHAS